VHLARLDGGDVVYRASRESTHQLRLTSRVGRRLPAHSTALGKALLAQRSDDEVAALLPAELAAISPHTLTELPALFADLAVTRARGYAAERGENTQGLGCVAVALSYREPALDAISCSVPLVRLDDPAHATAVLDAVRAGARELNSILRTL
jgi:DNA-binding IclR family transcriptional regulator